MQVLHRMNDLFTGSGTVDAIIVLQTVGKLVVCFSDLLLQARHKPKPGILPVPQEKVVAPAVREDCKPCLCRP